MKLLYLLASAAALADAKVTKESANSFLKSRHPRDVKIGDFIFDSVWEAAKDTIEENEDIAENDKEQLESCTKTFHGLVEEYKEDLEDWVEEAGFVLNVDQPAAPVYGCMIGGKKVNLTEYVGAELFR